MSMVTRNNALYYLMAVLVVATALAGCGGKEMEEEESLPTPSPNPLLLPAHPSIVRSTPPPTPTLFAFGPIIDSSLDLRADPVNMPLELQIPSLNVNAPILAVGLTADNVMDSPKGSIGAAVWSSAFLYRGGGVPGDVGTATIAGHVNDPLGEPMIFAYLDDLQPGDLIIIHLEHTNMGIRFIVDQIAVYSIEESSDPAILTQIYGAGPVAGTAPQPAPDGLSHLTLITCAGYIINGQFDHHTVVYATRSE
jgi:sortase (surface protein transpeptidase)